MKRIKLSKFKAFLKESFVKELLEGQNRLRRGVQDNWPGESHSNFEEDVDRLRRAQEGQGETEFEEASDPQQKKKELCVNCHQANATVPFGKGAGICAKCKQKLEKYRRTGDVEESNHPEEDHDQLDASNYTAPHWNKHVGKYTDMKDEDVAIVSSDEDIEDVLGLHDKTNKIPVLRQMHDLGNDYPTQKKDSSKKDEAPKKTKQASKPDEDKDMTDKQKKFFGSMAGEKSSK